MLPEFASLSFSRVHIFSGTLLQVLVLHGVKVTRPVQLANIRSDLSRRAAQAASQRDSVVFGQDEDQAISGGFRGRSGKAGDCFDSAYLNLVALWPESESSMRRTSTFKKGVCDGNEE